MAQENMLPCVAAFLQPICSVLWAVWRFRHLASLPPRFCCVSSTHRKKFFADSVLYLRIYFIGTLFNILYNMGAGVLQAVADTRHPLYYLCAASAVNIVLDVVFVAVFRWGVAGVAAATLIAQTVSATLAMAHLLRTKEEYRLCSLRGDAAESA